MVNIEQKQGKSTKVSKTTGKTSMVDFVRKYIKFSNEDIAKQALKSKLFDKTLSQLKIAVSKARWQINKRG